MLGQGNRTALPICGYFLGSVLNDPAFKQYRCKLNTANDHGIYERDGNCSGYFNAPADSTPISTTPRHRAP